MKIISIPYNMGVIGDRILGIDSYFWESLSVSYRKTLLIRPAEVLREHPKEGSRVLSPKTSFYDQINDLIRIKDEARRAKYRASHKFYKWKTARFFGIPLPRRGIFTGNLEEAMFATSILDNLSLNKSAPRGVAWFVIKVFEEDHLRVECLDGTPRTNVYQWLLENDPGFRGFFLKMLELL